MAGKARAGVTRERVIEVAETLIDEVGPDALTLAALAARLGIKTPSLYAHVRGIDDVREGVRVRVLEELADALQHATVGRAGPEALEAMADAYRRCALAGPGRYPLSLRGETTTPEASAAAQRILHTVQAVLAGYGLEGDVSLHATRALRSALHGFVSLELAGGFALDLEVDASFERYVQMLDAGLHSAAKRGI